MGYPSPAAARQRRVPGPGVAGVTILGVKASCPMPRRKPAPLRAGALGPQEGWFFFCSEFPHFLLLYFSK